MRRMELISLLGLRLLSKIELDFRQVLDDKKSIAATIYKVFLKIDGKLITAYTYKSKSRFFVKISDIG